MNYIQQANKGKNEPWMFLLTFLLTAGLFIYSLVIFLFFSDGIDLVEQQQMLFELVPSKNFWLAFNLLPFAFLLGLLFLLVKKLHQRSILSLTTSRKKVDWSRVFFSFSLIVLITLVSFGISYYNDPSEVVLQLDPVKFGILVVISLLLFPFQIGLEEYLFRGYMMQHLGVLLENRWMPLLITSILFGVFHSANPEVAEMGYMIMIFYIGTGLLLGIMTLMDDGLELALGFHLGNNLLAATLVTSDWSALQTDAAFKFTAPQADTSTLIDVILPVLVLYPIMLLILSKKYNWTNWSKKLFGNVNINNGKMTNWYLKVLKQFADFNGRARRKEYWMFILSNIIFAVVAIILDNVLGIAIGPISIGPIYGLYVLSVLIPGLAVIVRRLHDIGKSGWMILITLIPLVGPIWFLVLMLTEGYSGENQYGENPKDIQTDSFTQDELNVVKNSLEK